MSHQASVSACTRATARTSDSLLKNADLAMYHAKDSGRNNYQFFSVQMNARVAERLTLESRLKQAISRQEFILQYQPEMEIIGGRMIGAEALIRWQPS